MITPEAVDPQTINEIFAAMIGRDGSNRSATTELREAAEPALLLGQAADAYTHAIVAGAETLIGPTRLAAIDTAAEHAVPGISTAAAWETLRGHLAVLAADGRDPVDLLAAAAADRELDTARDVAAVLDHRLDPTGNHSQRPGAVAVAAGRPGPARRARRVGAVPDRPRRPRPHPRQPGAGGGRGMDVRDRAGVGRPVPAHTRPGR